MRKYTRGLVKSFQGGWWKLQGSGRLPCWRGHMKAPEAKGISPVTSPESSGHHGVLFFLMLCPCFSTRLSQIFFFEKIPNKQEMAIIKMWTLPSTWRSASSPSPANGNHNVEHCSPWVFTWPSNLVFLPLCICTHTIFSTLLFSITIISVSSSHTATT